MLLTVAGVLEFCVPRSCVLLAGDTEGPALPGVPVSWSCLAVRLAQPSLPLLYAPFAQLMGWFLLWYLMCDIVRGSRQLCRGRGWMSHRLLTLLLTP